MYFAIFELPIRFIPRFKAQTFGKILLVSDKVAKFSEKSSGLAGGGWELFCSPTDFI
jgi:hypothetical protein